MTMTHDFLTQATEASVSSADITTPDLDNAPILDTMDGCTAGQSINAAIGALNNAAEESSLQRDASFGLYSISGSEGRYILFESGAGIKEGNPANISTLVVVVPLDNHSFYYSGSEVARGDKTTVEFTLDEEVKGFRQTVAFSGTKGDMSDKTARISQSFAQTFYDITKDQHQQGEPMITTPLLSEIKTSLASPELTRRKLSTKIFGGIVLKVNNFMAKHRILPTVA